MIQVEAPLLVKGLADDSSRLAWANLALLLGVTCTEALPLVWSADHQPGFLTIKRDLGFRATTERLVSDVARCSELSRVDVRSREAWFDVDIVSWAMWFHERQGEVAGPTDSHGRFARSASLVEAADLAHRPVLDEMTAGLREFVRSYAAGLGLTTRVHSPWPVGKSFAVALSHDIDHASKQEPRQVIRKTAAAALAAVRAQRKVAQRRLSDAAGLAGLRGSRNPHWLMGEMVRMEEGLGFRATYFVLPHTEASVREGGRKVRRYDVRTANIRSMLADLESHGAELALHTTYDAHDYPSGLSRDLAVLQGAVPERSKIEGVRSHYLRLVPQTLTRTKEAGLRWDSTLGWQEGWGFRTGTALPFRVATGSHDDNLWELGLHVMDVAVGSGGLSSAVDGILGQARAIGGVASILIHPNPMGNSTAADHVTLYKQVLEQVASFDDAWVTTGSNIIEAMHVHRAQVTS